MDARRPVQVKKIVLLMFSEPILKNSNSLVQNVNCIPKLMYTSKVLFMKDRFVINANFMVVSDYVLPSLF